MPFKENIVKEKLPAYGGQAVIEGVMMRGKSTVAMAVRSPDGKIKVITEDLKGIYKSNILKIPFLRGLVSLWDSLGMGMKFLTLSANEQTGEDEKLEGAPLYLTIAFSLMIGVGIFFLAPSAIAAWIEKALGINSGWGNLVEGGLRLIILIVYLILIGQLSDIKRTFAYHGAEHKTINAFEEGVELTSENVSKQSLEHPRCGTSFILTLVFVSVLLFSILPPLPLHWRLLTRLLFIPVIAGVSYEYIRLISRNMEKPFVRIISKPNLALQKLTTREPSVEMLEVSIKAFLSMYEKENLT